MISLISAPTTPRQRPGVTLAIVCAAIVLVPISATGASLALPGINAGLHTGLSGAQWVVDAFFLTFASFMAVTGSLADLIGRRRMFAGGVAVFCGAMVVAGLAPGLPVLVAGRALAGAGAAATTTGGSALIAQSFDGARRTRAFAWFGTSIGVGLAFGPIASGLIITSLGGWRAYFLIAAALLAPVLAAVPRLPESRDPTGVAVDRAGAAMFTLGLSLFVFAIVEGPSLGWGSPEVLGALAACALLLAGFTRVERRAAHPLVDVSLLANARFAAICAMPVLLAFSFVALLIVLPPYLAAVDSDSALQAGLTLLWLTAPTLLVPFAVARLAERACRSTLLIVTMVLVTAGSAWLTVLGPRSGTATLAGPLLTLGVGFGISLAIMDGAAVASVPASRAGMAAGMFNTARLIGEAIAIAALGAILTAVTRARLAAGAGGQAGTATGRLLQGDLHGALAATGPGIRPAALAGAYTGALHTALWAVAGLMALGTVAVAGLTRPRLLPSTMGRPTRR
jgi:MFS family permease